MEAFAATAFVFHIRVLEFKAFLQAFFGVVELSAVEVNVAFGVDKHFNAVAFEYHVFRLDVVYKFECVGHA